MSNFLNDNLQTIKRLAWEYPLANAKFENNAEIQVRIEKLILKKQEDQQQEHHEIYSTVSSPLFKAKITYDESTPRTEIGNSVVITFLPTYQQEIQSGVGGTISCWPKQDEKEKTPEKRAEDDPHKKSIQPFPHNIGSVKDFSKFFAEANDEKKQTPLFFTDTSGIVHTIENNNNNNNNNNATSSVFISLLTISAETPVVSIDKPGLPEAPTSIIPLPSSFSHKSAFPTKSSFVAMLLCGLSPNFINQKFARPDDSSSFLTLDEISKITKEELVSEKFGLCEKFAQEFIEQRELNAFENEGWSIVYDFLCTCDYPGTSLFFDKIPEKKEEKKEEAKSAEVVPPAAEKTVDVAKDVTTTTTEKEGDKEKSTITCDVIKKTPSQIRFERVNALFQMLVRADAPIETGGQEDLDIFFCPMKKTIKSQKDLLAEMVPENLEKKTDEGSNEATAEKTKKVPRYTVEEIGKEYNGLLCCTLLPFARFLYLLFFNTIRPKTNQTARAFAALIYHLGFTDKSRASHFNASHSRASISLAFRGSFITMHASRCALMGCVTPITRVSHGAVWLDAVGALIVTESTARAFFGTQEMRDVLVNQFINNEALVPSKFNNYVVHCIGEIFWKIIANQTSVQANFVGSGRTPERIQSTLNALLTLGKKITVDETEQFDAANLGRYREEIPRYYLDPLSGSAKEAERCDDDEKFLEYVKSYLPSEKNAENDKKYRERAIHDWVLSCFCATERDVDCKIKFGQSVEFREAFERILPHLNGGSSAEWFSQVLTNILDSSPHAGKIWATNNIQRAFVRLLKLKELQESDSATLFTLAALTKIVKCSVEIKKLFATISLRDALVDCANGIKTAKSAQWWFTCACRIYEKSDEVMSLFATEEVLDAFVRLAKKSYSDDHVRWFGMSFGTLASGVSTENRLRLFGKSPEVRDALVHTAKFATDDLTLDWWFSTFQKITLLGPDVLGMYCSDAMRDEIQRLGYIAKTDKTKAWVKVVKDMIAKVPRSVPDPTMKNAKYLGSFEGRVFVDDALLPDEVDDVACAPFASGAASVNVRTWIREGLKF